MSEDIECPHCGLYASVEFEAFLPARVYGRKTDASASITMDYGHCPSEQCLRLIVREVEVNDGVVSSIRYAIPPASTVQFPDSLLPDMVSQYKKARRVLPIDANASAAMSRRCLQMLLRGFFRVKRGRLQDEIQALLDTNQLPTYLARDIDRIRDIGNLGAHPEMGEGIELPDSASREEAEWSLEILEGLFEHIAGQKRSEARNKRFDEDHPGKGETKREGARGGGGAGGGAGASRQGGKGA